MLAFDFYLGHRMDTKNHNWMLFSGYLSLSFSFMTLVIRDHHQNAVKLDDYDFDVESYNFNINMKTFLTCNNFCINHEFLIEALKKLE